MTSPRRRADATQNRARIIAAAREHIVSSDDLRLNEIAKAAGVWQGTLYRNFPTREETLVAAAPALLAEHAPFAALAAWFRRVAGYAEVKRGVFGAVTSAVQSDLSGHSLGPIGDAITSLLDAGKADGTVRDDADARDVILLIGYLTRLDENEWDARAHHLLDIILDGLRRPA